MLKVELNGRKGIVKVEANGVLPELLADVTTVLSCMYDAISDDCKDTFVEGIKRMAEEELFTKSNEEMKELNKKQEDKNKEKMKELINEIPEDLLKILKDILK